MISTVDHKAYNETLWSSVSRLRTEGVPVSEIDGGYTVTVNAWLQYVRPEHAHREPNGRITIPFFNDMPSVTYTISNSPLAGHTIVDKVPYGGLISFRHLICAEESHLMLVSASDRPISHNSGASLLTNRTEQLAPQKRAFGQPCGSLNKFVKEHPLTLRFSSSVAWLDLFVS